MTLAEQTASTLPAPPTAHHCACGRTHAAEALTWRAWPDLELDVAECPTCGSTIAREVPS